MSGILKAIVVEDSRLQAQRIVDLLQATGCVEVVATAATEDEALLACERFPVTFAVVDLQLELGTGFGVIRQLRSRAAMRCSAVCIVVLTCHAVPALKVAAFEAGADYFLDKSKDLKRLPMIAVEIAGREPGPVHEGAAVWAP